MCARVQVRARVCSYNYPNLLKKTSCAKYVRFYRIGLHTTRTHRYSLAPSCCSSIHNEVAVVPRQSRSKPQVPYSQGKNAMETSSNRGVGPIT